jgi:hypothetical protein
MKNPGSFIFLAVIILSAFQSYAQTTSLIVADFENNIPTTAHVITESVTVTLEFEPLIANWEDIIPVPAPGPGVWQYFTTGGSSAIIANPFIDDDNPTSEVLAFYRPSGEWLLTGFFYQDGIAITKNITGIEFKIFSNNLVKCYVTVTGIVSGVADQTIVEYPWPWTVPSGAGAWNTVTLPINADTYLNDTLTTLLIFPNPQLPEASIDDTIYIDEVRFLVSVSVDSVVLNYKEVNLIEGENIYLEASVYPENAGNKNIFWVSLNTDIVTVSSIGKVTAVGIGIAPVVVITEDGNHSDTCYLYVESVDNIPGITAETLYIRPNPYYGGKLEIFIPGDPSRVTGITIYNLLGSKVFSLPSPSIENPMVVQLPRLANGIYLVVAEYKGNFIYGKLIGK